MTVYLVGAGPGDPGLLTVRGAEVLARADVVVHDRLAEIALLDLARPSAERLDVGKSPGGPIRQETINSLLVEHGLAGREVVRLKGGDPFVFGRGGEEAMALAAAGVPFEVVPGVTSAIAVPAYAGIPVTHRGRATSFTVVTGHSRHAADRETNWGALAQAGGTIVVLMGVAHRAEIARRLMAGGLAADTPVAAVRWGSRPQQETVRTTLAGLATAALESPSTIVIGAVAGLDLAWYEKRPLVGRRVVVTRTSDQASALSRRLRQAGAEAVELPTIEISAPSDAGTGLLLAAAELRADRYDWVCFTSANAVAALFSHLRDARQLGRAAVAAVGPGTAAALADRGVVADLVPERAVAEGLLAELPGPPAAGGRVLLPQAAGARAVLADGLAAAGWAVDRIEAYRTVPARLDRLMVAAASAADAVCFTSASTVTSYLAAVRAGAGSGGACLTVPPVVVSIGPITSAAAVAEGLNVTAEAAEHTLDGLVAALVSVLGR
jgi:uroporphyrinogen III methyltransferase / synthase